jgi:hypothetical protein
MDRVTNNMQLQGGQLAVPGDVIQWEVYDSDDNITWTFTGVYTNNGITYLGGGIDFGTAVGTLIPINEVVEETNECGSDVIRLGVIRDLVTHISKFGT